MLSSLSYIAFRPFTNNIILLSAVSTLSKLLVKEGVEAIANLYVLLNCVLGKLLFFDNLSIFTVDNLSDTAPSTEQLKKFSSNSLELI